MLEAEINPAGDVTVEGHHVGSLQGFRFTADQSAGGEDAKAVKAAAQKALGVEFEARAERFANSANGDFALASDGLLRWIGAPVATLAAAEDPLSPRVILLADEQLTGAARDKVAARAERFVRYQIETLLKPLVDLKAAEQLSGMARGIAFRLVENFGLLYRRDVADEVKGLDQEARAALRRLGVRFGAFHVFAPALLKPGPAGLVTLLWSLANDGKDKPGFGDVVNALASGRTSLVVDPAFETAFYRLAGYRVLGRRAVRVDILERLADLIRPALAWRAGSGPRPQGAWDGAAFIVTPAMMSILGATAEDMEEILKSLGYRSEAKPAAEVQTKLEALDAAEIARAEAEVASAEAVEAPTAETPAPESADAPASAQDAPAQEASDGEAPAEQAAAEVAADEAPAAEAAVEEVVTGEAPAEEPVAADEAAAGGETPTAGTPVADAPAAEAFAAEAPAEEAKPVLLWRPGRAEGRPRHGRGGNRQPHGRGDGEAAGRKRFERRPGGNEGGQDEARARDGRPDRSNDRNNNDRHKGKPPHRDRNDRHGDRHGQPPRKGQPGGQRNGGQQQGRPPREERPARIDPDSPFAKLAALREQLKGK
jgi:ATP-dependent RNA helicase SUPV3L1/SUV3